MKKLTVLLCVSFMCIIMNAQDRISFTLESAIVNERPGNNGRPKSPMCAPIVYIEDYTLSFVANHPDYGITIKDKDGKAVYTTVVTTAETQVILPSTQTGSYMIELTMGDWAFIGWIEL